MPASLTGQTCGCRALICCACTAACLVGNRLATHFLRQVPLSPVSVECSVPTLSRCLKVQLAILLPAAHWVGGKPRSADSVDETDLSLPEDRLPFTLSQVATLLTVARTGSITSAALALSISQPAVSKSLSSLEQVSRLHRRVDTGLVV